MFYCNCSEIHPLVARRKKSKQKPVWPLFLYAQWFALLFLLWSFPVFSEYSSLMCTTCAFLQFSVVFIFLLMQKPESLCLSCKF